MAERKNERNDYGNGRDSGNEPNRAQTLKAAEQSFDQIIAGRQDRSDRQRRGKDHANRNVGCQCSAFLQMPNQNRAEEQRGRSAHQRIDTE